MYRIPYTVRNMYRIPYTVRNMYRIPYTVRNMYRIPYTVCCEAVLLHYIVNVYFFGDRCLQCYTLPVITFCLSLLNAIAGYFVFR